MAHAHYVHFYHRMQVLPCILSAIAEAVVINQPFNDLLSWNSRFVLSDCVMQHMLSCNFYGQSYFLFLHVNLAQLKADITAVMTLICVTSTKEVMWSLLSVTWSLLSVTSSLLSVTWSLLSVCHSLTHSISLWAGCNQLISLTFLVMIGPTNQKNSLTSGSDMVPDTDSRSFFHFPHHCTIGDFRRFISISHTITGWFSWHSAN